MSDAVVLLGCGDVGPIHQPMGQYSELVGDTLAAADIRFAQVERVYSDRGELRPHGGAHGRLPPHMASVITDFGFNVVSVVGNHDGLGPGAAARYDRAAAHQEYSGDRRRPQSRRSP